MVTKTVTSGRLEGSSGSDTLTGVAQEGTGQIHVYAGAGNDTITLDFSNINKFSHGHHARGDGDGSNNRGADIFDFTNLHRVDDIVVGRLDDFDPSRDSISINGSTISLNQLESGSGTTNGYSWRIVEYDSDSRDSVTDMQQWLLIDTSQGYVFYALEGARVTNGDGAANDGDQEAHFIGTSGGPRVTASELASLETIGFVDPQNYVPAGLSAQGGTVINDYDHDAADASSQISGTSNGDLIAAGLNDDNVAAEGGSDLVWGGSGNDTINGNGGSDTIHGGTGKDKLTGGVGGDFLYGGRGADTLNGLSGNDRQYGERGDDKLYGHQGNDLLDGGRNNDKLFGSTGDDTVVGGRGKDLLNGGEGRDIATGGSGDDTFVFETGDLLDWDNLSGSWEQKNDQLDVVTDFTIGSDKIEFDDFANVNSMSDLKSWKTTIDGNDYFTVQVRDTNERVLVDVDDSTSWSQFFDDSNFLFT